MTSLQKQVCKIIEERTSWVNNDLKAFLYIRLHDLQHGDDDIGGGNVSAAIVLFTLLGLYSKINYFIERPDKFVAEDYPVNETAAFVNFAKQLKKAGLIQDFPQNGRSLEVMWSGFRDHLAHRFTVEDGKSITHFTFEYAGNPSDASITSVLADLSSKEIFIHDGTERNWSVYGDALHARLPVLCNFLCSKVESHPELDWPKLINVIK